LKKTAKIAQGVPNFNSISEENFLYLACNRAKAVRRLNHRPIDNPEGILDSLEGDTFSIKPISYNKYPIRLLIVDRKSRFRWLFLLKSRDRDPIIDTIKGFFRSLKALFRRYPKGFHFNSRKEINTSLQAWLQHKGLDFSTSSPYIHEQNSLIKRSIRVILDHLKATILTTGLLLYL
jgi:hypothetical protein